MTDQMRDGEEVVVEVVVTEEDMTTEIGDGKNCLQWKYFRTSS